VELRRLEATTALAVALGTIGTMAEAEASDEEPEEGTGAYFLRRAIERLLDFSDLDEDAPPPPKSYETDPNARPDPIFLSMAQGTLDDRHRPPLAVRRIKAEEDMSPIAKRLRELESLKHGQDTPRG
jgi:hypothetical protein